MIVILYVLIGLQILGIIGAIALIGDPRKPKTKGEAVANVILSGLMIVFYIALIERLKNG